VGLAKLEIYPAQVEAYKAALREEIEALIREEPGVLMLYVVAVKDHPKQIRLFEMCASPAAYAAHL
jgi:quinol monooxygenase YgiN